MGRSLVVVLALCTAFLTGCVSIPQADQDARTAAVDWLALLDRGDYQKAFDDRPPRITASSKEDFLRFMRTRRAPLGKTLSREFVRVSYRKTLLGAPDGNYGFMYFKTKFEHKSVSVERVIVSSETGQWQVTGYRFQ